MTCTRNISAIVLAFVLAYWVAPAHAACPLSGDEIRSSIEFTNLRERIPDVSKRNRPEWYGFILGQQTRFLGDSESRREMYDCLFAYVENFLVAMAIAGTEDPTEMTERFRSAALGLMSDEELRELGIDPAIEVASIFEGAAASWLGKFDAAAVCVGNGLAANCALPVNEVTLDIDRDSDTVEGTALVTVRRPNEEGCAEWVISSTVQLTGIVTGIYGRVLEGSAQVISRVEGYVGSDCTPLVRDVPIAGTWNGVIANDQITGHLVTPGETGEAKVPFTLNPA